MAVDPVFADKIAMLTSHYFQAPAVSHRLFVSCFHRRRLVAGTRRVGVVPSGCIVRMVGLGLRRGDHSWLLSRNQKLLRAAAANQPERVLAVLAKKKNIFKKAADVNASDAAGRTTLHYSVLNKNEGLFQNLLEEHKADSSVVDKEGDSVMLLVAKHGTYREAVLLAKDPSCSLNTRGKVCSSSMGLF